MAAEDHRRTAGWRGLLVGAIGMAVLANIAQYAAIDREVGTVYSAISRYDTSDIAEIGVDFTPTVRERFQLYLELGRFAAGSDLIVPPGVQVLRAEAVGLGRVAEMRSGEPPVELTAELADRLVADAAATGIDRRLGEFHVAVAPGPVEQLYVVPLDDSVLIVDERLLPAGGATQ